MVGHRLTTASIFCAMLVLALQGGVLAADYLQMPLSCDGERGSISNNKYRISNWNGKKKIEFGKDVYDFYVQCENQPIHLTNIFQNSNPGSQFKKDGSTIYMNTHNERVHEKIRDRSCSVVPEDDICPPSNQYEREICGNDDFCRLDLRIRGVPCQKYRERCTPAEYQDREIPVWESFSPGYAPLPAGAVITQFNDEYDDEPRTKTDDDTAVYRVVLFLIALITSALIGKAVSERVFVERLIVSSVSAVAASLVGFLLGFSDVLTLASLGIGPLVVSLGINMLSN